jgi:hypothetical protein
MAIRTFNSVGGFSVGENPSTVILANGDITTTNANLTGNLNASIVNTGSVIASGDVSANTIRTDYYLYANGAPVDFQQAQGSNGQIQYNLNNDFGASSNLTFDAATNTFFTSIGNIPTLTSTSATIATASITGSATVGDTLSVTGNVTGANLISNNIVSGTTFTGTNLSITSTATVGNLNITGNVTSNLVPSNPNLDLGSPESPWRDLWISAGTIKMVSSTGTTNVSSSGNTLITTNANVPGDLLAGNLTVLGFSNLLGNLTIAGNLTVGGNTTYVNVDEIIVKDPIIELGGANNGGNATTFDGKDRGMLLHNYYANNAGPINQYLGWKTSDNEFQALTAATISNEVISGVAANLRVNALLGDVFGTNVNATNISATNLTGTLQTSSQTNITQVGTLTDLNVSGNLDVTGTASLGATTVDSLVASGITYPLADGSGGQFLKTYGNGVLAFASVSSSDLSNGTSNIVIQQNSNVNMSVGGTANVGQFTTSGLVVQGNITTTGNVGIGYTNIKWASLTTTTTVTDQIIASVPAASIRGVEFFVKGEDTTGGKYVISTIQAVHDGSSVDYNSYGTVRMGTSPGTLAVAYASGSIRLTVSPSSTNSTVWTTQYKTI